jgi:hypothetical protein
VNTKEIVKTGLTPAQQALSDLRNENVRNEFAIKDANAAQDTMTPGGTFVLWGDIRSTCPKGKE